jgi:ATP-dependent RNA/DNA helicase IGHMBP2
MKNVGQVKKTKTKASAEVKFLSNAPAPTDASDDNFDALVAAAVRADRTCSAPKCKNSTATLGQTCLFCRRIFCLTHHQAEVHGCGDEARRQARATAAREGKLYPGSGVPSKKPDPARRTQLESKLTSRLNDMADKRKKKPKDKEK